jgi:hypothetical protein
MNGVFVMANSRLAKIKRKGEHLEHLRWNLTTSDLITIGLMDEDVDGGIDSYILFFFAFLCLFCILFSKVSVMRIFLYKS